MGWIRRISWRIANYGRILRRLIHSAIGKVAAFATRKPNPPGSTRAATRPTRSPSRLWVAVPATHLRRPTLRRRVEKVTARFTRGHRIGSGGQGHVYAVQGRPDVVLKELDRPIPGALPDFDRLVESKNAVQRRLADANVDLCWPSEPQIVGDALVGYVMPRMAPDYYHPTSRLGRDYPRSLDFAVREASSLKLPFTADDQQRVQLVRLVARFLNAMHAEGLAYGDVSWDNFTYQVDPEVRLSVYDFDSTRIIGRRTLTRSPAAHTVDWEDPKVPEGDPASFDTDRYRFALLAYRMLVSKRFDGRIDSRQISDQIPALNDRQVTHLRNLWVRADGARGTRPTIHEWLRALES